MWSYFYPGHNSFILKESMVYFLRERRRKVAAPTQAGDESERETVSEGIQSQPLGSGSNGGKRVLRRLLMGIAVPTAFIASLCGAGEMITLAAGLRR